MSTERTEHLPEGLPTPPPLLTRQQAADYLTKCGFPIGWRRLAYLAVSGGGPTYRRWGKHAVYATADLLEWAEHRAGTGKRRSTSEGIA